MAPFEKLYLWQLATNEKPPGSSFIWNQEKTRLKFPLRFYECSEKYLPNAPSQQTAVSKANASVDEDVLLSLEGGL